MRLAGVKVFCLKNYCHARACAFFRNDASEEMAATGLAAVSQCGKFLLLQSCDKRLVPRTGCPASVRDYGIGISREGSERLFERYFTTKAEGLGMGLSIVRTIVESHDGQIIGEKAEGGGAQFHFTLPIKDAA